MKLSHSWSAKEEFHSVGKLKLEYFIKQVEKSKTDFLLLYKMICLHVNRSTDKEANNKPCMVSISRRI